MTTTAAPDRTDQPGFVRTVLVLGALVALGPLTIDMYLPALPAIVDDLGTTEPLVQLTLTGTLVGLGLGQLVVGPLSDAFGRRRPLFAGIALHIAASALSAFAWNIAVLGGLRVLQGAGAAAATVVAMAVVRDLYDGPGAAKALSRLMLVMGAAPVLAPSMGSAVLLAGSWRWVFGLLAALGLALLALAAVMLAETLPPQRRRPARAAQTLSGYRAVLRDGEFVALAGATGLAFGAILAYISGSSFVLQEQYGLSNQEFGVAFAGSAVALIGGSQLTPLLLRRTDSRRIAALGLATMIAAGAVLTALQASGSGGLVGFFVPVLVIMAAGAVVVPNTTALALSRHGQAAGTAAAVVGALQFGLGSVLVPVVGLLGSDGSAVAQAMTATSALALLVLGASGRRGASPGARAAGSSRPASTEAIVPA